MLHQEWSDGTFFPIIELPHQREYLSPGAVVIWEVEAASWGEAIAKRLSHKGEPQPEMAVWQVFPGPYSPEQESLATAMIARGMVPTVG